MRQPGLRWRTRRQDSWWLFALVAAVALAGLAKTEWKTSWWWAPLVLGVAVTVGGLFTTRMQSRAKALDDRADQVDQALRTGGQRGGARLVKELNDAEFGVHPAQLNLPYIPRDREIELTAALEAKRPVIVVGDSMTGKTRMSAQVVRKLFPDRPIVVPVPPDGLAKLLPQGFPNGAVVWLNDLELYLVTDGLRVEWIDRMLRSDDIVLATMRAKEHEKFQPTVDVRPPQAEIIERFTIVRLKRDSAELARIAANIDDKATRRAVARYGLAEYVGGAYLAVQRYETGESQHPLGVAMIRAAVDWRRVGLDSISPTSLAAVSPTYLPERFRYDPKEDTPTALAWATELVDGMMRLLEPTDAGGYRAFDYILDHLSGGQQAVPDYTWREAAAATTPERALSVGYRAYLSRQPETAQKLWQMTADLGAADDVSEAAFNLGVLHQEQKRLDHAAAAYQLAIDSNHPDHTSRAAFNLGGLRQEQGRLDAAAAAYQLAIDSNHPDHTPRAAVNLGGVRQEQGRLDDAAAFQLVIDSNHPDHTPRAAFNLGVLRERQRRLDDAAAAYQLAIDSHHPDLAPAAAFHLGALLHKQGRLDDANAAYQLAIDSNHEDSAAKAAVNLDLLRGQ